MKNMLFIWPVSAFLANVGMLFLSGCGNFAADSDDRSELVGAKLFEAQMAFDKEDYETAEKIYLKVLEKDSNNIDAHIGLAYTYNAQAGLSVHDMIKRSIKVDDTKDKDDSEDGAAVLTKFTDVLGYTEEENKKFSEVKNFDDLLTQDYRFAKLVETWKTVCPFVPASLINELKESTVTDKILPISESCGKVSGKFSYSAYFAAALASITQATKIYQLAIDQDGNGKVDLIDENDSNNFLGQVKQKQNQLTEVTNSIDKLSKGDYSNLAQRDKDALNSKGCTSGTQTTCLLAYKDLIDERINEAKQLLKDIVDLRDNFRKTFAQKTAFFQAAFVNAHVLVSLGKSIKGLPDSLKKGFDDIEKSLKEVNASLNGVVEIFNSVIPDGQEKLDDFKSLGGSSFTETEQKKEQTKLDIQNKAKEAAKQVDDILDSKQKVDPAGYPAKRVELCTEFDVLAKNFGSTDIKPCHCKENVDVAQCKGQQYALSALRLSSPSYQYSIKPSTFLVEFAKFGYSLKD